MPVSEARITIMSAELAKPDSMGDLDQEDEEAEEMEEAEAGEPRAEEDKEAEQEAEERMSLLTEEQKEKSSPSIQLVAGEATVTSLAQPQLSSGSGANIKVDIEQGPSPRSVDPCIVSMLLLYLLAECLNIAAEAVIPGTEMEAATQCVAPAPSGCPSSASSLSPSGSSSS